jgi:hypothetical protein
LKTCHEAAAERRRRGLVRIGHAEHLEIAAAERHDPVVRPEPLVSSTARRAHAELRLEPGRRRVEVRGGIDHVIDPHGHDATEPACLARPAG